VVAVGGPEAMTTDGTNVYFANDASEIFRYSPSTSQVVQLFDGAGQAGYNQMLASGAYLYLAGGNGNLMRMPLSGGAPTVRAHLDGLFGITADSTSIYATSSTTNSIWSCGL
jgi:hypothetical protein